MYKQKVGQIGKNPSKNNYPYSKEYDQNVKRQVKSTYLNYFGCCGVNLGFLSPIKYRTIVQEVYCFL